LIQNNKNYHGQQVIFFRKNVYAIDIFICKLGKSLEVCVITGIIDLYAVLLFIVAVTLTK